MRNELLPALRSLHPAAEANVLRTLEILRDEAEVLDSLIDLDPSVERIAALPPALRRLTVQAIAGAPSVSARTDEILALAPRGGSASLDLGGGLRAVVEYGRLRFDHGPAPEPAAAVLPVPGAVAFGAGLLTCEAAADGTLDAAALGRGARGAPLAPGGSRWAAARCRTSSPTARSRASAATRCPSWCRAARSPGSRAWRRASGSAPGRPRASACV